MPIDWTLICYGCSNLWSNRGTDAVAYWTFASSKTTIGLCRDCLNKWLDDVDSGICDEPDALLFLVAPDRLMAAA